MENISSQSKESVCISPDFRYCHPTEHFNKKKNIFKFFFIIIIIALCFGTYSYAFRAPEDFPLGTIVHIKSGENLGSIANTLKEMHTIQSRFIFETFVMTLTSDRKIPSGDYTLDERVSVFSLARRFAEGDYRTAKIKITFPEGITRQEIKSLLMEKISGFDGEQFLLLTAQEEGYLFPETYFFFPKTEPSEVREVFRDTFNKKIDELSSEISRSGRSERQIVIMASLIEGEAKGNSDRDVVSGILWNRIVRGEKLQVDVAPDTYDHTGLPVEPISNPGFEAMFAAIHPKDTPYLFYLHDKGGIIHYAKTFAEHKANIAKYLK
ncbi:MAG: endolytic transglycosylase MltG [Candidatus Paceibacterota bacterium]|jgi:UPF0755 protein